MTPDIELAQQIIAVMKNYTFDVNVVVLARLLRSLHSYNFDNGGEPIEITLGFYSTKEKECISVVTVRGSTELH